MADQTPSQRSTAERVANAIAALCISVIAAFMVALADGPQWGCVAVGMIVYAQVLDV